MSYYIKRITRSIEKSLYVNEIVRVNKLTTLVNLPNSIIPSANMTAWPFHYISLHEKRTISFHSINCKVVWDLLS